VNHTKAGCWATGVSLLLLLLVCVARPCAAETETNRVEVPLTELVPFPTADLRGADSRLTVSVPIPKRWQVREARLHFAFVNSAALIDSRSLLVVRLNRRVLAQVPLQAQAPEGEVDLKIPARLFTPGYNNLEFSVAQNYTEECSDPQDPVLWTTLEMDRSHLEIVYSWKPVPMSLASVADWLFDPKLFDQNEVHLVVPDLTEPTLARAALTGAAVAMRFEYRTVFLTLSGRLRSGVDNIVIGGDGFVSGLLGKYEMEPPAGQLGILPLPGERQEEGGGGVPERRVVTDPGHALIVISGQNEEELENALRAFSVLSYPLPDAPSAVVKGVVVPEVTRYTGRALLAPGKTYRFENLGFTSTTYQGTDSGSAHLSFRLPSDILLQENALAVCSLHLAYGAEMRKDSVLNLYLNDKFTAAVPLDQQAGVRFRDYKIMIPMHLFRPGENSLRFDPVLTPLITGQCERIQTRNLAVTLYDDSSLEIPGMVHWTEMPRLELFFQDGFPFAAWPDWRETTVLLTRKDEQSAGAAVNLVSMICQKNGVSPARIRFAHDLPGGNPGNLLVVGPLENIPDPLLDASPIGRSLPYPFPGETDFLKRAGSWWDRFVGGIFPGEGKLEEPPRPLNAQVVTQAVLGEGKLLLMEYLSPFGDDRSVLVMAAGAPSGLDRGVRTLWSSYVRGYCRDNLVLVEPEGSGAGVVSERAGTAYFLGKAGTLNHLNGLVNVHPLVFAGGLVLCLFLIAWILLLLIRRRKAKRFGQMEEG